jgi:hypothetical protein
MVLLGDLYNMDRRGRTPRPTTAAMRRTSPTSWNVSVTSAIVHDDDGEQRPGFNLDNSSERAEAIDRLMDGQDTTTYDSSYEVLGDK